MAVERIEEYKQTNGVDILKVCMKPTAKFPNGGYFYAPAEAIDLVNKYTWHLQANGKNLVCVEASDNTSAYYKNSRFHHDLLQFHTELFRFYQGYKWQEDIDHVNMVEIDNTDENLNAVTRRQNGFNRVTKNYSTNTRFKPASFQARVGIDAIRYQPFKCVRREDEACNAQNYLEQVWLRERLGEQYYMFDFKKYRRGSEDILDLERTGQISEEEAIYRHILRYADNAWYYLRYGLQEYFKENHIPVPQYSLDEQGFMIHPITGQKLCPFTK